MVTIEFGKAETQKLDPNSIFITFSGYDFRDNLDKIKSFWNRRYLANQKHEWEVPFCCFDEIKELYKNTTITYLNNPPKSKVVTDDDILNGMDFNGYNLFDYQLEAVKYGLNHNNWLLLDCMGLGKTLTSIVIARYKKLHRNLKHCLVVCGVNSLKWNWQREIEKFCKEERGIVLGVRKNNKGNIVSLSMEETKQQIENCPEEFFWIINIEKMRVSKADLKNGNTIIDYLNTKIREKELGMVIIDELHKIKQTTSQQSLGLLSLDPSISKLGMTGTLLVNNPYDLYAPMTLIGLINYNKWVFEKKFVIKDDWGQILGYQNMDELHEILFKSSLRRTKDLLTLPEKLYKQEWLELNSKEQDVFDQIIGKKPFKLDKIEEPTEMVSVITRMRQCTVASELLTTKSITSSKFERLKDICDEAITKGEKVLVFCPFTEALKLGLEYMKDYRPKLVCGGMGEKVQQVVDEHENTEGFSLLFAQEATLGVGYTLINTSIVVFLSPPWSRATYDQCADRCFARNTIVMTTKGPKYIQHVKVNDYVYTPYGNIKRVMATHLIEDNQKFMAKVKIKGLGSSYEIKCTADHKVLTKDGIWKEIKDFQVGDYVFQIPEVDKNYGYDKNIDMTLYNESSNNAINKQGIAIKCGNSYMFNNELKVTKELMFLCGMYIGDGFVQKDNKFFSICGNDTTKLDSLYRIQNYIKTISVCSSYICNNAGHSKELRVNLEPFCKFLNLNFGRICEEKYIPSWIYTLKKEYLESFFEGIMRSDGCIRYLDNSNKTIKGQFITITPAIATGVWFLCYRLGYKASFAKTYDNKNKNKIYFRIEFSKIQNINVRADRNNKIGRITDIKLYQVKNHKNIKLYDISIEDDACYMVGNLPVHNCFRIRSKT